MKYALVWGTKGYKGDNIAGDNNARLMSHVLARTYKFPKENLKVLINNRLTMENMLSDLVWLRQKSDENSVIVLFYSGHGGMTSAGKWSYARLNEQFQDIRYERLGLIFECCFSGNACELLSAPNRVIIGSTRPGATGGGTSHNSLFSHFFIKEAMQKGLADVNGDGQVSVQEAFNYYHNKDPYVNGTMIDDYGQEFLL